MLGVVAIRLPPPHAMTRHLAAVRRPPSHRPRRPNRRGFFVVPEPARRGLGCPGRPPGLVVNRKRGDLGARPGRLWTGPAFNGHQKEGT